MSTYWGYRCTQDGAMSDTWFNHGEHILRSCVWCYPLIQQLYTQDSSGYLEVHLMGHAWVDSELWNFLGDHYAHGVELYNEYGAYEAIEEKEEEEGMGVLETAPQ